jgi:hypothetical protein
MFKVPMQNLFGAGLLLTLAFSVNDHSSPPGQGDAQAAVQLACDNGGFSREPGASPNAQRDAQLCREIDVR